MIDINKYDRVHFIGIGGVSMSGLAETLLTRGFAVTGSDNRETDLTERLRRKGIAVAIGQRAENIGPGTPLVVYTAAVKPDNAELAAATARGLDIIDRAQLMGLIMREYSYPVCVSGTHGKTTTTSMIADIFIAAGKDPTINLGGILPSLGSNYRIGASEYFIAESCEYFDSFLQFYPFVGVILNVEADHLDYFRDLRHIEDSFRRFAGNIHKGGALIINGKTPCMGAITDGLSCRVVSFGAAGCEWSAGGVVMDDKGRPSFTAYHNGEKTAEIKLGVCGAHNVDNALAALAAACFLGIPPGIAGQALETFAGAGRRFELKGEINGITVIDDYAHHPTEITATLAAAGNVKHNRLVCVFQPHTYSRTKAMKEDIIRAFEAADVVVLTDIYSAREKDTGEIHSRDLLEGIRALGVDAYYFPSFDEAEIFLLKKCIPGDMLITMGAGDIYLLGESMLHTDLCSLSTGDKG